ncbi:hypothetical protein, partial [Sphingomonas adhaesiva]|uniref:hypothetical protein n=1 Tax=Sphingomonas adhaesiva TaxID=28212 RepID=UPI0035C6D40E
MTIALLPFRNMALVSPDPIAQPYRATGGACNPAPPGRIHAATETIQPKDDPMRLDDYDNDINVEDQRGGAGGGHHRDARRPELADPVPL